MASKIRISVYNVKPGMTIAGDVYTSSGQLIIPSGAKVTDDLLNMMKQHSIAFATVLSEGAKDQIVEDQPKLSEDASYRERVRNSEEFKQFQGAFEDSMVKVNASLQHIVSNSDDIDTNELLNNTTSIFAGGNNTSLGILDLVNNLRYYDDSTYAHSLNVSIICRVLGKWLHLSDEDVDVLTVAGLLHDLGKFMIPEEIVKKPGKLTDEEFAIIKKHPYLGFQHVKDNPNLDDRIKAAMLQHHEKCDGTGYPSHLTAPNIAPFAKMVAIADVYEAMTATRVYREGLCPFHVIRMFEDEGYQKYEVAYLLPFLENIVQTYINNRVKLNNGQIGEIIMLNRTALSRPIINVDGKFIDMSYARELTIEEVL
ncbi:MAG: HD-GYP domain-containing protein [Lachnospiraceae bacterium]|nr:HD-GYP domain-containing protein [Lachnospiraceae bacterium]